MPDSTHNNPYSKLKIILQMRFFLLITFAFCGTWLSAQDVSLALQNPLKLTPAERNARWDKEPGDPLVSFASSSVQYQQDVALSTAMGIPFGLLAASRGYCTCAQRSAMKSPKAFRIDELASQTAQQMVAKYKALLNKQAVLQTRNTAHNKLRAT